MRQPTPFIVVMKTIEDGFSRYREIVDVPGSYTSAVFEVDWKVLLTLLVSGRRDFTKPKCCILCVAAGKAGNLVYHRLDLLPTEKTCMHLKQLATVGKL